MKKQQVCECCGQEDGRCPTCGSRHVPAVERGCENCVVVTNDRQLSLFQERV